MNKIYYKHKIKCTCPRCTHLWPKTTRTKSHKIKLGLSHKGTHASGETRLKMSLAKKGIRPKNTLMWIGKNHPRYKHGKSNTKEYKSHYDHFNYIRRTYKVEGFHTFEEWENLKKTYGYICLCCKRREPEINLTKDHIIPISMNGTNYIWNIQPLCMSCNSRKNAKEIDFRNVIEISKDLSGTVQE